MSNKTQKAAIKVYEAVTQEHEELWDKIQRLQTQLDTGQPSYINDLQWKLLKKQNKAMRKYNKILAERCNDLYASAFHADAKQDYPESFNHIQPNHQIETPGQIMMEGRAYDPTRYQLQADENFMQDEEDSK